MLVVWAAAVLALLAPRVGAQGQGQGQRVVEGILEAHYEDYANTARITHFLNTGTERIPVQFRKPADRRLLHGSRVRLSGTMSGGTLMLTDDVNAQAMTMLAPVSPNTFGAQSTLVILFTFTDNATQPYTPATAQSVVFTDTNNFYIENSYGQTSLTGTVAGPGSGGPANAPGWLQIAANSSGSCAYNTWAMLADQAATNAGYVLANYPRRVYGFPQGTNNCGWLGLGTIGGGTSGNPARAWINTNISQLVVAHEMGHGFGLYHSHSDTCDSTGCTVAEYGDDHDAMGNYFAGHFNAHQKERLGWLNYGTSPAIQTVTSFGPYTIEAYEADPGGLPKGIEILKATGASNTYLYAEARTQNGLDWGTTPGVLIHTGNDTDGNQSLLEDVFPTTTSTDFILDPGQSVTFSGPTSPITFTTLSSDNTGAVVAVTQSSVPCSYSLGSSGQSIAMAGGSGSVTLNTTSDCYWNAISNASWITVNAGSTNGQGTSTVQFTVDSNSGGGSRVGTLTITGRTYTVTQAGTCSYTVSPFSRSYANTSGGSGSITVTAAAGCSWTAASNASWITGVSPASSSGNGSVNYTAGTQSLSANPRSGTMTIAGQTVTIYEGRNATTMLAAAASGTSGGTATLSATLTQGGSGLSSQSVAFTLNGTSVGSATTNGSGVATLSNVSLAGVAAGTYTTGVIATFAPTTGTSSGSAASNTLTVTSSAVNTTLAAAAASGTYGATANLSATLTASGSPVSGKSVAFTVNGSSVGSAVTDAGGVATLSGASLSGILAGSYASGIGASFTGDASYSASSGTGGLTVNQKSLTGSVTVSNKTYDGTPSATIATRSLTGALGGDTVTLTGGTATFVSKDVGVGKTVTATGLTLTGAQAGNYTLASTTATTTANITVASVTGSVTASNKTYDGTPSATVATRSLTGVLGADVVTLTGGTATFASKDVGVGKTVTVTGLTIGGTDALNYTLASTTATTTANITVASVTASVTASNKPYDSTLGATIATRSLTGVFAADAVTLTDGTATFASKDVGVGKTVTATGLTLSGADAPNYTLASTTASTTANITVASVTGSVTASNKTYDGGTSAAIGTRSLTGVLGADVVTLTGGTATFASKDVGVGKTVTATGLTLSGADAPNYTLASSTATTTANITVASVTGSVTASNKVYDGTPSATIATRSLTGVLGADVVTLTGGTATFASKDAGVGKTVTVTGLTLGGADALNYTLSSTTATTTANVNVASVTGSVSVSSKAYDGTPSATIATRSLTGVFGGDAVTLTGGSATFASKDVGVGKTVTVTGLTLSGAQAGNYTLASTTATTTANITVASVTASVTASNKTYDGNPSATIATRSLTGVLGGDDVTLTGGTATFASKDVGVGKTVTVTGLTLSGAEAGNYTLSSTMATTTASISMRTVTAAVTVAEKEYDRTTVATLTACTLTGQVSGDAVTCNGGTANFDNPNAGVGKPVTVTGLSLAGASAANYALSSTTATTTGTIDDPIVTATVTASDKPYDGSTTAAITSCSLSGVLPGDELLVACNAGPASFNDAAVGTGKTVTTTGLALSGQAAGNYTLSSTTATTTAAITAISLTPTVTVGNKIYDGTTAATLTSCTVSNAVVIAWDPNPLQEDVLGYVVKVGTASGVYGQTFDIGNQTTFVYPNAVPGQQYFFGVASYNATGTGPISEVSGVAQSGGVVGSEVVGCTGSAVFDSVGAGTGKTATVSGITLTGAGAANYSLSTTTATATASIAQAVVTPVVVIADKTYDGTTDAILAACTLPGAVDGASCTGTAVFDSASAGLKTVTVSGLTSTSPNYQLAYSSTKATATITAVTVTASVTAADKLYDGSTNAALSSCTLTGLINGDQVGCAGLAAFASPNVGMGQLVTVTNLTLSGAAANNYALTSTIATTSGSILPVAVTPSVTVADKSYDGNRFGALASCTISGAVTTGLVAAYSFDEGTGTTVADWSGHGNNGTVIDALWTSGMRGGALSFNGFDSRVTIPDAASLQLTTAMTVEAWIRPATIDQSRRDVIHKGNDDYYLAASSANAARPVAATNASPDAVEAFGPALPANAWTHLVGTYDGTMLRLYVNGLNVASVPRSIDLSTSAGPLEIGADSLDGRFFGGVIDEVRVYNVALSPEQVYANMVSGPIGGRPLLCTADVAFDSKDVGTGKTVTASNIALSGADAANYTLASTTATTTASITAVTLTPAVIASNKTYDGSAGAAITCGLPGLLNGDTATCTWTSATFDTKYVGVGKTVTVTGLALSGGQAANYTLASTTATALADVTPATVTPAVTAANKAYDGTMSATVLMRSLAGVIGGDDVNLIGGTATFASKFVGVGKAVTVTGLGLSGAQTGNYALASTTATTTADITAATLTAAVTVGNKTYDGGVSATIATRSLTGVLGSDDVTLMGGTATFASKDVGVGKSVTVTGLALTGNDAANYVLASTTVTTAANVTAATVTATVTVANKTYDGNPNASIATRSLAGVFGSDDVTLTAGPATFASKDVGVGKSVTVTGLGLSGNDAANYLLASATVTTTANITPATLTATVTAANKTYDSGMSAAISTRTLAGILGSDDVTLTGGTATFASKDVGVGKTVTITGLTLTGNDAPNYVLASATVTTTANISPATLTATVTAANKTYDGGSSATIATRALAGILGTDDVTLAGGTATFASKGVAVGKTVTVTGLTLGGNDAPNYVLASATVTTTANVTAATVTPTVTVANKTYDAGMSATIATRSLTGVIDPDDVTLTGGTAMFASKDAGVGKTVTVTGLTLSGNDAPNYVLANATVTATANVTAATVTAAVAASNKTYDGGTSATISTRTATGVIDPDDVMLTGGAAAFASKDVGVGKTVTVTGLSLSGAQAGNYALASTTATTTADITAASLTATVTAANKTYDGGTGATISTRALTGVIDPDDVTLTGGAATFASKDVGAGKTVTVTGLTLSGNDAPNYALASTTTTTTANITTATLTATVTAANKTYDGNTAATIATRSLAVVFGSDDPMLTGGAATFDSAIAGTGKTVTVTGLTLSGDAAGNYTLASTTATTTATIDRATPTITWAAPADIFQGTPLSGSQLNASASVPGTFEYTPATGAMLSAGASQALRVTFTPEDATNYASATGTVNINVLSATPVISPVGNLTTVVGAAAVLQVSATDPAGNGMQYGATGLPPGLAIDANTGTIAGSPSSTGSFGVTVTVTDVTVSVSSNASFTWTVSDASTGRVKFVQANSKTMSGSVQDVSAPFVSSQSAGDLNVVAIAWQDQSAAQIASVADGAGNSYQPAATPVTVAGVGTQVLYYAIASVNSAPAANVVTVTFTAPVDLADLRLAEYNGIEPANSVDTFVGASGAGLLADTGQVATSWDKDLLLAASFAPVTTSAAGPGFTERLNTPNGALVEDTTVTTPGLYRATVSLSAPASWIIQMVAFRDTNVAPTLANPGNQAGVVGGTVSLSLNGSDPDGDTLTYSAVGLPAGLILAANTGHISGTFTAAGAGIHSVSVTVSDGKVSATQTFLWTVTYANGRTPALRHDDFDGDAKTDIIVYRPGSGTWFILKSQGNYVNQLSLTLGGANDIRVLGDYDGDGKPDPAVFRPSTGQWLILYSSSNYTNSASFTWGVAGDLPVPGDYDGDGKTDIAVFHPPTRQWKILYSSSNYTTSDAITWGVSTDVPVPGDYDGDGRTDIAVYHRATGEWQIRNSASGTTTAIVLGESGDLPVPADYDGDGRTDVAVYKRAAGQWQFLNSASGLTTTIGWGSSTDIPVPGDYDGDGRADLVVYRPGSGTWFVLESHSNYATQWSVKWGGSADQPGADAIVTNTLAVQALPNTASVARVSDFDGDGKTDIAVYRPSGGGWFIKNSRTNYATQTAITLGTSTDIPTPGDYDGDGKTDAAYFRPSTGEWKILYSASTTSATFVLGVSGDLPVPGDYDGDGRTDLAVFHAATRQWQILYSSAGFASGTTVTFGSRFDIPVPGDYDGDGVTDLAVYHAVNGQWQIRQSRTLTIATVTLGGGTDVPVPGDYDGDGKTDVAVYHRATAQWQIRPSTTGVVTAVTYGSGTDVPVPADYDGDGKTDVAVFSNGQWQILRSTTSTSLVLSWGTGTDRAGPNTGVLNALAVLARPHASDLGRATDFDGDGRTDITVFRPSNGTWFTLKSQSNYSVGTFSAIPWGTSSDMPVAGDYDGDGKTDPAYYRPSTGEWKILFSSSNYSTPATVVLGSGSDLPVPGDYDGDGITDVAIYHPPTGEWTFISSSTGATTTAAWGTWTDVPVPGDYDGDLITDFAVFHPATGEWRIRYSSTGAAVTVVCGSAADLPVPADYDGDGRTDVAVYRRSNGQWQIVNSSTGAPTTHTWGGAAADVPMPGDYDGDGKADLAVFRANEGKWYVKESHTNFTTQWSLSWGTSTDKPGPSVVYANTLAVQARPHPSDLTRATDFDGDGRSDIAVFRPADGTWNILKSLSNYSTQSAMTWGTGTDIPVAGDYDGDGKTDPAFYHPSTGEWQILYAANNYTTYATIVWGALGDVPVPGDYDGDGKTDPAVFRPSTGEWRILTSSSNYTSPLVGVWGSATDRLVPGDYDGDGKMDLAYFTPSTKLWHVLFSSANYTTNMTVSWGASTDIQVPADFDGDGKADIAVFRPSSGTWYVLLSRSNWTGQQSIAWGATGDRPVVGDFDGDGKSDPARFAGTNWMILLSNGGTVSAVLGTPADLELPRRP